MFNKALGEAALALDYKKLLAWDFGDLAQTLTRRDTMLYALGIGLGSDPTDPAQLRFVYEENLEALPTMGVVLAFPGFWFKDPATGINWQKILHGEESITILRKLPVEGRLVARMKVAHVIDRGDQGAFIYSEREIIDAESGDVIALNWRNSIARADGNFGGPDGPVRRARAVPERPADQVVDLPTLPQSALIYRLSGDYNPLHADPVVGRAAGFRQPILHGLCTYGIACRAILEAYAEWEPARLASLAARFSAPVIPGDTLAIDLWRDGDVISFEASVPERGVTVLKNGRAELRGD